MIEQTTTLDTLRQIKESSAILRATAPSTAVPWPSKLCAPNSRPFIRSTRGFSTGCTSTGHHSGRSSEATAFNDQMLTHWMTTGLRGLAMKSHSICNTLVVVI
ncbi:hypothetical protein T10_1442 [Trichinella papuae]|uniref:Uncharacterized protein n=1 Tax=Trichinella papuae TaxID=268474 RepID=A0A0V1N3R9_9BILA|nr:hypothetical protein T10_1442 [Trichinella papuae]